MEEIFKILEENINKSDEEILTLLKDKALDVDGFTEQDKVDFLNENVDFKKFSDRFNAIKAINFSPNPDSVPNTSPLIKQLEDYFRNKLDIDVFKIDESEVKDGNEEAAIYNVKIRLSENLKIKSHLYYEWNDDNTPETFSNKKNIPYEKISVINSLSDYLQFISNLENASQFVSRGQGNCMYDLVPSLHRENNQNSSHLGYELISEFSKKGLYYDSYLQGRNSHEVEAYGQHYGLPTSFLDFTEAHMLSLFFAVENYLDIEQYSVVYFINSKEVNLESIDNNKKLMKLKDNEAINELESKYRKQHFFLSVDNSNPRIHFQKGCFMKVSEYDTDGTEMKKILENHTNAVLIPPSAKKKILDDLYNMGITSESVYPDLQNLVKSIKFQQCESLRED